MNQSQAYVTQEFEKKHHDTNLYCIFVKDTNQSILLKTKTILRPKLKIFSNIIFFVVPMDNIVQTYVHTYVLTKILKTVTSEQSIYIRTL